MRTLRTAVVAAASVAALTFGTSAAVAAETPSTNNTSSTEATGAQQHKNGSSEERTDGKLDEGGTLSSKIGAGLEADKAADGQAIFGSSKDIESQPVWAKLLYALTWLGGIGSFLGLIAGPLYNFVVHGLPQL